jgi:DNA-binding NtrC family response regulator
MRLLTAHPWPGNVRELLHTIEAAMIVSEGPEILPEHLPVALRGMPPQPSTRGTEGMQTLEQLERSHIERAIQETGGHRGNAAKILGISERNLYRKLREYGLLP